jgi:hypothetical protein
MIIKKINSKLYLQISPTLNKILIFIPILIIKLLHINLENKRNHIHTFQKNNIKIPILDLQDMSLQNLLMR